MAMASLQTQGKVEQADEIRLLIKTTASCFDQISELVKNTLSYQNPEILSIPVLNGSSDYLDWIDAETQR